MGTDDFYGKSLLEEKIIINRFTYKGRGRPCKGDYQTVHDAQRLKNYLINRAIENAYRKTYKKF